MFPFNLSANDGFSEYYSCYSVAMLPGQERDDVETGGKIIMPPTALEALTRLNVSYPMLFKLRNPKSRRVTHCGVLEFVADEERIYLPHWMMMNLTLEEGDGVEVESIALPVATFSRFQPQSPDFLDIYNPKAVLENTLRKFACLTTGDIINIKYNQRNYELSVLETQPGDAVSIIECDMNVDFAPPLGYVEPQEAVQEEPEEEVEEEAATSFVPFAGEGYRLDGKPKKQVDLSSTPKRVSTSRGVPDYDWKVGTLVFMRNVRPRTSGKKEDKFEPFSGSGNALN